MRALLSRLSIPALLVTLVVVAICLRLSAWQLERAEEKRQWISDQQERSTEPPRSLEQLLAMDDPQHYAAGISGSVDNARTVLLDNRMLNGIAGYYLLTPLHTEQGHWVLVNRGWIARGPDRNQLPDIPPLPEQIQVDGMAYRAAENRFMLADAPLPDNQWPLRVQSVDFDAIGEKLGVELAPFEIRVAEHWQAKDETPLPRPWKLDSRMGPDQHKAYALQWFVLAIAALLVFVAATVHNARRHHQEDA